MNTHIVPAFGFINVMAAVVVALIYITLFSLVKEPRRQTINALIIAGAGAVYWSGGLGLWEFLFGTVMLFVAYKGLTHYKFIGSDVSTQ